MKPSMSTLPVLQHCRAFASPAYTWDSEEEAEDEDQQWGLDVHASAEIKLRLLLGLKITDKLYKQVANRTDDMDFVEVCEKLNEWIDQNIVGWQPEQAVAWDWESDEGRILKGEYHRDYRSVRETEVPGTLDAGILMMPGISGEESVDIVDFKTGVTEADHYEWQMKGLALAFARAHGCSAARTRLVYVRPGKDVYIHERRYDSMTLDAIAEQLKEWMREAQTNPEPIAGPHCFECFCPARLTCKKTQAAMTAVNPQASMPFAIRSEEITSPEHAVNLHTQIRAVKALSEAANEALKIYIKNNGPISVGNKHLFLKPMRRKNIDGKNALKILEGLSVDPSVVGGLTSVSEFEQLCLEKMK